MSTTYEQLPGEFNLAFRAGDDASVELDFSIDLTGYTVTSSIVSLTTGETLATPTTTLTNAATGVANIALTKTQTAALPIGTLGLYFTWDAPGPVRRTALGGYVEVSR
jgi:hypothetical protein